MKIKLNTFGLLFLIISFTFIIPLNIGNVYGTNTVIDKDATRQDVYDTCSFVPPVNVKDSLIMSVIMMCIPGILEKLQEYKQIKCEVAVCSYEAVLSGNDPSFCKKFESYQTCKYIVGDIFAIPPMAILDHLREMIANALANPVGIAWGVAVTAARKYATGCAGSCSSTINGLVVIFLGITDISAAIQTFKDIAENGFFPRDFGKEACDELDSIKEELEKIVNS